MRHRLGGSLLCAAFPPTVSPSRVGKGNPVTSRHSLQPSANSPPLPRRRNKNLAINNLLVILDLQYLSVNQANHSNLPQSRLSKRNETNHVWKPRTAQVWNSDHPGPREEGPYEYVSSSRRLYPPSPSSALMRCPQEPGIYLYRPYHPPHCDAVYIFRSIRFNTMLTNLNPNLECSCPPIRVYFFTGEQKKQDGQSSGVSDAAIEVSSPRSITGFVLLSERTTERE